MAPKGHHKRQDGRKGGAHSGGAQAQPAAQRRTAIELTAASEASVRSILQVRAGHVIHLQRCG